MPNSVTYVASATATRRLQSCESPVSCWSQRPSATAPTRLHQPTSLIRARPARTLRPQQAAQAPQRLPPGWEVRLQAEVWSAPAARRRLAESAQAAAAPAKSAALHPMRVRPQPAARSRAEILGAVASDKLGVRLGQAAAFPPMRARATGMRAALIDGKMRMAARAATAPQGPAETQALAAQPAPVETRLPAGTRPPVEARARAEPQEMAPGQRPQTAPPSR